MRALPRARLVLVSACLFALGTLIFELPVGQIFHQRSELAAASAALDAVTARNSALSGEIASLRRPATIATIAHADYGLVERGQSSIVVLPGARATPGAADSLAPQPLPANSVVPGDPASLTAPISGGSAAVPTGSLWSRVLDRLSFWRWAF